MGLQLNAPGYKNFSSTGERKHLRITVQKEKEDSFILPASSPTHQASIAQHLQRTTQPRRVPSPAKEEESGRPASPAFWGPTQRSYFCFIPQRPAKQRRLETRKKSRGSQEQPCSQSNRSFRLPSSAGKPAALPVASTVVGAPLQTSPALATQILVFANASHLSPSSLPPPLAPDEVRELFAADTYCLAHSGLAPPAVHLIPPV